MDTLVKPRLNHYQLLGLAPSATDEEIRNAFAREVSPLRPHAFGDIALLSVAHETLRDPAKRRAYDESIGLGARKTAPPRPLQGWQYKTVVRIAPVARPPAETGERQPEASVAAIAPERAPDPAPAAKRDWAAPRPVPLQHIQPLEDGTAEWKRPVAIAGGIFVAVGLMGVLAGLWAARDVHSSVPQDALQIPAPAEARTVTPALDPPAATATETATSAVRKRAAQPRHEARSGRVEGAPAESQEQRAEDVPEIPTEQVAALTSATGDAPAAMPLSNATIARTIGRIGYSCGEVASTSAVEGAEGVFRVTCTSGQSYRAAPVRGRYHFRRWN